MPRNPLTKPDDRQPVQASAPRHGLPEPIAMVAWNRSGPGSTDLTNLASDADSFEASLPREPHGVAMGIAALMAVATPTPVPPATGPGCHRWRYALRWEQPSRLAILKNVLGNSVTTNTDFKAPGSGNQNDWPDPIAHSEISGAWDYTGPSQPTVGGPYNHDCGVGLPACAPPTATDVEGEHPGIWYSKGTWDWPDPNSQFLSSAYDPARPPLYHPGADTTGSRVYEDTASPPTVFVAGPYGAAGNYDAWAWTLNYGYAAPPPGGNNDIIYGPDPGPPLKGLMDLTDDGLGNSIPGLTGTPLSFPAAWTTRGGSVIGAEVQTVTEWFDPIKKTSPLVTLFNDPALGLNQPSWTVNLHRDVVSNTKDVVNWGLMTYHTTSGVCGDATNWDAKVPVVTVDTGPGDDTAIEGYMRLRYYNSAPYPGLAANGGTPTAGAIAEASKSLMGTDALGAGGTWGVDPKKACNRPYGVILCTDGQSNVCNTGSPADLEWDQTTTPCTPDTDGTAFVNFPPGAAETMYLTARQAGAGDAIVRARTFAIGISSDISRCELNRTAYRGRTDANSIASDNTPNLDAGFVLYDSDPALGPPLSPSGGGGDVRLPHVDFPESIASTNESGGSLPVSSGGFNRFGPDQSPPDNNDYAFFASDARALHDAILLIVQGLATGDYTTSSPVSGASVSLGSTVILTSTTYPRWHGHIRALDTSAVFDPIPGPIVELWDAGAVLTKPDPVKPWQPTPATRQLYTWDPVTGALIEIIAANAPTMDLLCGSCGITPTVVDFIRGIDTKNFILGVNNTLIPNPNKGLPRKWLLGPSINVTPAIVGPAHSFFQTGNVTTHQPFESAYASRRPLAWLGADDGFLHAFDLGDVANPGDGAEIIGLLPPNLIANQVALHNTFQDPSRAVSTDTGQNAGFRFDQHTWGVANSLRFADVWFGAPTNAYKTVGFLTEGPGGDVLAAIDITHPYGNLLGRPAVPGPGLIPADNNYGAFSGANAGLPVDVIWTKSSSDYAGLFGTWSVPAVGNDTFTTSKMTFGAGINPTSLYNAQQSANLFVVDPVDGSLLSTTTVAPLGAPSPLVGHQTFADAVIFQTNVAGFQDDNLVNLSLQGDTNGRVNALFGNWASPTYKLLIDLNTPGGGPQPLYYSPAASGIGTLGFQVYALASGSFYETSPAVSGWNVNRSGPVPVSTPPSPSDFPSSLPVFVPTLFVATNPNKITDVTFGDTLGVGALAPHVQSQPVAGIPLSATCFGPGPNPAPGYDPTFSDGSGPSACHPQAGFVVHTSLGPHTQVTASPLLVSSQDTSKPQTVLFTVFDPDFGCNGFSYVIKVEFTIGASAPPAFSATTVYAAGAGAASGFVVTDKGAFTAQSGVGKNEAGLIKVDIPPIPGAGKPSFRPVWWKEQR